MATFNGSRYINEQLNSIITQLDESSEIVISDDSSTDNTVQIIKSFNDKRIQVLPNQKFRNPIFNFENSLKHAQGDYIFLADQDDIWMPERLNKMIPFFENYDLIVSDCRVVDENLEVLTESYFASVEARPGLVRNLICTSPYIGCCMAFKRNVLERALPFPKSIPMHDFWIALIAESMFKVKFISEPLLLYRRHGSNASFTASKSNNPLQKKILYRIQIVTSLVRRLWKIKME